MLALNLALLIRGPHLGLLRLPADGTSSPCVPQSGNAQEEHHRSGANHSRSPDNTERQRGDAGDQKRCTDGNRGPAGSPLPMTYELEIASMLSGVNFIHAPQPRGTAAEVPPMMGLTSIGI